MSRVGRLDIKSLVSIVDENELLKVLNENVYYYNTYWPNSGYRFYTSDLKRVKTIGNPLQFLIFNYDDFTSSLLRIFDDDIYDTVMEEIENLDLGEEVDDLLMNYPTEYPECSEIIWKHLASIKIEDFLGRIYFNHENNGDSQIQLLDGNLEYLLPASSKRADNWDKAKKFLLECGFKE